MADVKISALPAASGVTTDDLVAIVDAPGTTPVTKKATVAQLRAALLPIAGTETDGNFGTVPVKIGATVSGTGDQRVAKDFALKFRAAANDVDRPLINVDGSDFVNVGMDLTFANMAAGVRIYAAASVALGIGGNTKLYMLPGATESWQPITGSSTASSPYGVHGLGTLAMADANQVVPASVYQYAAIQTTGALTASRDLTLPGVADVGSYERLIDNQCTGTGNSLIVKASSGGGATVTVWPGSQCRVLVDSRGVTQVGPKWTPSTAGAVMCAGDYAYAEAGATAMGPSARATNYYCVALGFNVLASGAAANCIGEDSTSSGSNSNCIGYASNNGADFASILGSYCTIPAGATGAVAAGLGANPTRPGEWHWRGSTTGGYDGQHRIDLYRQIVATTASLQQDLGGAFNLNLANLTSMRVVLKASTPTGSKYACEIRELLILIDNGVATILNQNTVQTFGGLTFAAAGWSCTISITGSTTLDFSVNSGADTIKCAALIEWSELGGIAP